MMTTDENSECAQDQEFNQLLLAARNGDRDALGQLLQWYTNYLRLLASSQLDRRLRRRLNPSDVVQEAMLAAHRDFQAFRGESPKEFCCWLRTILIHTLHRCFDRNVKVGKRDVRREVSIDDVSPDHSSGGIAKILPGRADSPSTPLRKKEANMDLAARLSKLKEHHRQVIELRVIKGLPFDQIARQMNRSSGAVRMLWLRALDAFKSVAEEGSSGS